MCAHWQLFHAAALKANKPAGHHAAHAAFQDHFCSCHNTPFACAQPSAVHTMLVPDACLQYLTKLSKAIQQSLSRYLQEYRL